MQLLREASSSEKNSLLIVCKEMTQLYDHKIKLLLYLESRMHIVAPNVCEIIGPKVTSKLISAAGGILELSRIPACNLLVIG
jgi:RNA processing factor Prp31